MICSIVAPQYKSFGSPYELPLGLAYLSSSYKKMGHTVNFVNLNEKNCFNESIKESKILFTGGLSTHFHAIKKVIDESRSINPSIIVVVGGGIISSEPEIAMKLTCADVGVIGEGELLNPDVIQDSIGKIINMPAIEDIDSLPYPDYDGLMINDYLDRQLCGDEHYLYALDKPRCLPVISSRSCPYRCSFCFHPTGNKYRQRSIDGYFAEIDFLVNKYNINMVTVLDELISMYPERINQFCDRIKPYKLKWMTQARVDSVNPDTLAMMKNSGCIQISFGIEHTNNDILKSYKKNTTIEKIEKTLQDSYDAHVGIQGNIILGGFDETQETASAAMAWILKHKHFTINATAVTPYPGTDLYKRCVKEGKIDPEKYILSGCPNIKMCETGFIVPKTFNWVDVIDSHIVSCDQLRGPLYYMKVKCPHCGEHIEYNNIYWGSTGIAFTGCESYRIGCRNCNARLDIPRSAFVLKKLTKKVAGLPDGFGPDHPDWNVPSKQYRYMMAQGDNIE